MLTDFFRRSHAALAAPFIFHERSHKKCAAIDTPTYLSRGALRTISPHDVRMEGRRWEIQEKTSCDILRQRSHPLVLALGPVINHPHKNQRKR